MKSFVPVVMSLLGISAWTKGETGKNVLAADDIAKLKTFGFDDAFLTPFAEAVENDFADEQGAEETNMASAVLKGLLGKTANQLAVANSQLEALRASEGANAETIAAKDAEIQALKEKVQALSSLPEPDKGAGAGVNHAAATAFNLEDEHQLGGMQGEMYALEGRPYNQRARAALLARQGILMQVRAESSIDYSRLKEDLGAFYRIRWQDRLQSFLMKLPSIESIFPVESGYQDLAVLVNIWLGEFSQSDNTSSDFDNVTKGEYEFDNETLRMFSVMFAHKFRNLKELEKSWIGYLNQEGSQVIKWSFIEFILAETAKKLHNERELRRINGVRKDPNLNTPGKAMEAADGLYEFIRKKVDGYIDINNGKTVYQIKPFELGEITEANIGAKFFEGTSLIPAVYRDSGQLALYVPSYMVVWYHKYNELHYGTNQDYKAGMMYVKEYPGVKLIPVPNADNHQRIFWTMEGNIHCFEHVAGEMTNFNIEQQDWTLKVWANWKESIWARAVGYKYTKKDDMDGSRQMIFCNEYDLPSTTFIEGEKDANPDVALHTSVVTVANTSLFTITDIENAEVGVAVTIKCGSTNYGVQILQADNFSLISAAWTPAKGDTITLMKRSDGKFIELGRTTAATGVLQFANDDATPSVSGATVFATGENTAATAITNLDDATEGVTYTIHGAGSTYASTIANSGNFVLTAAMTLSAGTYIKLVAVGTKFYEVERG
ncbi:MAG: hypothetical protein Q4D56_13380 [Bacteroides sp.]|nr:hypothetical protein [Bacteroides sp.]